MSKCSNGDPGFNLVLDRLFGSHQPAIRKQVFYSICIPVRLSLYFAVFLFRDHWIVPYIVGLASLLAIFNLISSFWTMGNQNQWWSKRFQAVMSMAILVACIAVVYKKINSTWIPVLLFTSLLGGIIQSLVNPIC